MANIVVSLWGRDLLHQWNNQIKIPAVPETYNSGNVIIRYHTQRSEAI